jgi:cell filamentation protein
MIDISDFKIPGTDVWENKLDITDARQLASAEADFLAIRLAELHMKPIAGAFTTEHLQRIHNHVFQDVYEWAGKLREVDIPERLTRPGAPPWEIEKALDCVFDKLSSENHLKGYDLDEWTDRSAYYLGELAQIQPFLAGNELVLREFTTELGRENDIWLQWDGITKEQITDELSATFRASRAANMRRLIMLAVDPGPLKHHRSHELIRNPERNRGRDLDFTKY